VKLAFLVALCFSLIPVASAVESVVPANATPLSVQTLNFTPKAPGKKGSFTYRLENRSKKPVAQVVMDMGFRDADGVLEKKVPFTRSQTLAAGAKEEEKSDDFFMSETTRNVTITVKELTFADGTKWSAREAAIAAAAPGALAFAGHDAPASVEVIRFRPKNVDKRGGVAWRLVNHSNKGIEIFVLEIAYLDAAGKIEKTVPHTGNVQGDSAIAPGETYEGALDEFFMSDKTRSVKLAIKSLTFAGGEKWTAPKSE
jgi:hypothetical protein